MFIHRSSLVQRLIRWGLLLCVAGYVAPVFAEVTPTVNLSAEDMLVNFAQSVPNLMRMVTAIAYVIGMTLILRAIVRMKHMGELRTQMSREHNFMGPLITLGVGAMLLYLPTTVQVGMSTFWTDPNPYAYLQEQDQWSEFLGICFTVIQLIGVIAFIRGLLVLSHLGSEHGAQHGTMMKGLTHIIGGILCINIYGFVQVITNTLGIQF